MKFCPMCGTVQDKPKVKICKLCDYEEKDIKDVSAQEFDELMSPFKYEVTDDGVRIIAVKNERSMRGAIAIPHFVTEIAENAFSCCKFLARIDLPSGLRSIGKGAFADCRDLFDVYIPQSVSFVGKGAFANCFDLSVICVEAPFLPDGWDRDWLLDCDAKIEWSSVDE